MGMGDTFSGGGNWKYKGHEAGIWEVLGKSRRRVWLEQSESGREWSEMNSEKKQACEIVEDCEARVGMIWLTP